MGPGRRSRKPSPRKHHRTGPALGSGASVVPGPPTQEGEGMRSLYAGLCASREHVRMHLQARDCEPHAASLLVVKPPRDPDA